MRLSSVLALVLVMASSLQYAEFTHLYDINGTNQEDNDNFFRFYQPTGLLYQNGKLYVADGGRNALYVMNGSARDKVLLSSSSASPLDSPLRMHFENGTLYIADGISTVIRTYSGEGFQTSDWNKKEGSNMAKPSGVAMDANYFYITDMVKGKLFVYSRFTRSYLKVGLESGVSDGELSAPADVEIYGGKLFVSDSLKGVIFAYDMNLTFLYSVGRGAGGITLTSPRGFEIYNDRIYVADATSNRVVVFTMDGYPLETLDFSVAGANFSYPEDVAVGDGKLFVADSLNGKVRAFSFLEKQGNETVAKLISQANRSVAGLYSLQLVARLLGVKYSNSTAAFDAVAAQSYYDSFMFSSAEDSARKAIDGSEAAQALLGQDIEIRIKQLQNAARDKVAPYRKGASGALSTKLVEIDNKIADATAKMYSGDYLGAANIARSLDQLAQSFVSATLEKGEKEKETAQNRSTGQFMLRVDAVAARLERLGGFASRYRQDLNATTATALIAASKKSAMEGDYDAANRSLELADLEIGAYETTISKAVEEIDEALSNISIMEFGLNLSAGKQMLLMPDITQEKGQLSAATQTAYANPQLALAQASQAVSSAEKKIREAEVLSTAASAIVAMLAVIGLLSAVFFIHIKRRRAQLRQKPGIEPSASEALKGEAPEKKRSAPAKHRLVWKE